MKKFLIGAMAVVLAVFLLDMAYYRWGFYINFPGHKEVTTFTKTQGKEILVNQGKGYKPYEIKAVDLESGIPGSFAADRDISKSTYLHWFTQIQAMGANTIRIYNVLNDDFYNALYEYNLNKSTPLYILQGVSVDDYAQNSHIDAYGDDFRETFQEDCRTVVDVIHGRKKMNLGYGVSNTSGVYRRDISPWVLGYVLGTEWNDVTVAYTNRMEAEDKVYKGQYMYTKSDATAFEALLAETGDKMIAYESSKYREQRLISFCNWATTDPLTYPKEINDTFMKCAKVDVEHIHTNNNFISGQFASYQAFSYDPDYLRYYDSWKKEKGMEKYRQKDGSYNTYGAYLELLCRHHTMPVFVSDFGIPTSRVRAQVDVKSARSRGYATEKEQGQFLIDDYKTIRQAGCVGAAVSSWQDEWFKRSWNTLANVNLNRTAYWSDVQTNDQFFGLLAFDPGAEESVCYTDGDVREWSKKDLVVKNEGYDLYSKYDERYVYFRVHKESKESWNNLYIPIDTTPKTGSLYVDGEGVRTSRPIDFLIQLDGKDNSRVLVQERYNAFEVIHAEAFGEENPYFDVPDKDTPVFQPIELALQLRNLNATDPELRKSEKIETGKLTYGNGNPESSDYNSVSDFIIKENEMEVRIPWEILNFSNPANRQIHDDYYENFGIENLTIDSIYMGIGTQGKDQDRIQMKGLNLRSWGRKPTYHERLKESYYMMQDMWKK